MINTNIKKATIQDLPILNKIALASKAHWDYPQEWIEKWTEGLTLVEKDLLEQEIYKLEVSNTIIAYCSIKEEKMVYDIINLWVLPTYIGKGYGNFLLNETIKKVVQKSKPIIVEADPNAESFYKKQGFVTFDKRESYPKGRFLPLMKKEVEKINQQFVIGQYQSGIKNYSTYTVEAGLWASEQYVFQKYLQKTDHILDLGCGTGRTTFPLYQLGYQQIIGIDLTPEMIEEAKQLDIIFKTNIPFEVGDATQLHFEDSHFDTVIFSFNGLMSIPNELNRKQAIREIHRVLKTSGTFIFTTHDRNKEAQFLDFWKAEKERWNTGHQNPKLYEFGDLITTSKNEERKIFIHIPDEAEVIELMESNGFEVIETFYRVDKFQENAQVLEKSGECRFWITRKIG